MHTHFALRLSDHFALTPFFTAIAGSLPDNSRSRKSEIIAHLLEKYKLLPEECLMVGDRHLDVEGARKNGIACIGVGYGYGSREELEEAGAAALADTVADLENLIRNWGN